MGQQQTMRATGTALRRILLVFAVAAMIAALLPGTAFAAEGSGGTIEENSPFGPVSGGRGGSGNGGGGGGHLNGEFSLGGIDFEANGGLGGGSSAEHGGGGGGGGCFTNLSTGERLCGHL
jgi:hypothetical protein